MKIIETRNDFEGARGKCGCCGTEVELEADDAERVRLVMKDYDHKSYWLIFCPNCGGVHGGTYIRCEKAIELWGGICTPKLPGVKE